jgi:hypothetical protein
VRVPAFLGGFLEQLGQIDGDTKALLVRLVIRANKSGNANAYLKSRLQLIVDVDDEKRPRPAGWPE